MKSSLRFISRVLVFAFATTLIPAHLMAMEEVVRVENPLLNAIRRNVRNHANIEQDIINLIDAYQNDEQLKAALLPLAQIEGADLHFDVKDLSVIENLEPAALDAEMNRRLQPLNNALEEGGIFAPKQWIKKRAVKAVLLTHLQQGLKQAASDALAAQQPTQEELQAIEEAQAAAREREAQATQAAQQARAEEADLEAQIAQTQAEIDAEVARQAQAERARTAALTSQAQALVARQNEQKAIFEAQEAAYQEQERIKAEARQRADEEAQVADANEAAAQEAESQDLDQLIAAAAREQEAAQSVENNPVVQEDLIAPAPAVIILPDAPQARQEAEEVFDAPVAPQQEQAPAARDQVPAMNDNNQPREEQVQQPVPQEQARVADEPAPAPAAQENPAVARLAALRAQQAAAHARAQETERARQEAERGRAQAEQAAQAPRVVPPAVPVNPAAAAAQPNAQAGLFEGGLGGMLNNLWERIQANPKTSAAIGIGVAFVLYNLISSIMGDDEDEDDDSLEQDEDNIETPAPEKAPVRRPDKPAKTTTTLSPEEAEQSRLQGLKRKRAQMRREFFKNRGSRCKSHCKKRCR